MYDIARIKRVAGAFARAPQYLRRLNEEVAGLRQEVGNLHAEIDSLQSTLGNRVDFAARSTLEALAFTNRSIEGVTARLDRLEKEPDQQRP